MVSSLMISKNRTVRIPKLVPIATTDDAWLYYVWFPKHHFSSSLRFSSCLFVKSVLWKACSIERLQKLILHLFLGKTCFFAHRDLQFQSNKWDWATLQISLPGPVKLFPRAIEEFVKSNPVQPIRWKWQPQEGTTDLIFFCVKWRICISI